LRLHLSAYCSGTPTASSILCGVWFINLSVHHAKKMTAWLERHKNEIEVFCLQPYAPEDNPDELLNSGLKRGISKRPSPRSDGGLEHNVRCT
jgi:hypothetical protein